MYMGTGYLPAGIWVIWGRQAVHGFGGAERGGEGLWHLTFKLVLRVRALNYRT